MAVSYFIKVPNEWWKPIPAWPFHIPSVPLGISNRQLTDAAQHLIMQQGGRYQRDYYECPNRGALIVFASDEVAIQFKLKFSA